jgi:general L-amino acid transport system permease protein
VDGRWFDVRSTVPVRRQSAAAQGIALGVTAIVLWWFARNTAATLDQHGISLGFGFLKQPANFEIGDAPIAYSPSDSFLRAILVGLANTARVSVLGWIFAVSFGFVIGVMRLAPNPVVRGVMRAVVELVRNVPLLLLLFLLAAAMHAFPPARAALEPLPGVFISDRGLVLPSIDLTTWSIDRPPPQGSISSAASRSRRSSRRCSRPRAIAAHISEVVRGAVLAVSAAGCSATRRSVRHDAVSGDRFVVIPHIARDGAAPRHELREPDEELEASRWQSGSRTW